MQHGEKSRLIFVEERRTRASQGAVFNIDCDGWRREQIDVFADFFDYNDFLNVADDMLVELALEGVIQVASFHPQYQFAETAADAVENYTNRSPYPMLHLLREESIAQLDWTEEELLAIPERNIAMLRALGLEAIIARCTNKGE